MKIEEIIGAKRPLYSWEVAYEMDQYRWLQILEEPFLEMLIKNPKKLTQEQGQKIEDLRAHLTLNATRALERYCSAIISECSGDDEALENDRVIADFWAGKAEAYYDELRMFIIEFLNDGHIERGWLSCL